MDFVIENEKLVPAINLLGKLSLKGKKSRHRTKMIKDLMEGVKEFEDQRQLIIKEHCNLNEEGEPVTITKEGGAEHYDVKNLKAFEKDQKELLEETYTLEGGNVTGYLKTMKDVLLECELEWSGQEADIYDYLCDEFEKEEQKGA
jgi:PHD/YefM family antitoxin component YafN of YafNO toxin-antitoxin module